MREQCQAMQPADCATRQSQPIVLSHWTCCWWNESCTAAFAWLLVPSCPPTLILMPRRARLYGGRWSEILHHHPWRFVVPILNSGVQRGLLLKQASKITSEAVQDFYHQPTKLLSLCVQIWRSPGKEGTQGMRTQRCRILSTNSTTTGLENKNCWDWIVAKQNKRHC